MRSRSGGRFFVSKLNFYISAVDDIVKSPEDKPSRSRDMALGLPDGQHVEEDDERNRREARRSDHAAHRRILLNPRHTFPPDKACGVRPTCLIDGIFLQCLAVAGRMAPVDVLFSTPNGG